jgi:hypothetical protein
MRAMRPAKILVWIQGLFVQLFFVHFARCHCLEQAGAQSISALIFWPDDSGDEILGMVLRTQAIHL